MVKTQAPPVTSDHISDQHSTSELLEKISDLTLQLSERDARIEELSSTLKALDSSRHSSVCDYHLKPRKRAPNSADLNSVILPESLEPPRCEEPINPLLPPHFSETWARDIKYQDELLEAYMSDADPFFVLAQSDFLAAVTTEPLTTGLELMQLCLRDSTRPYELLTFYGIFLGDLPYSRALDNKLHEVMQTVAASWGVEEKPIRYMVWNDDIEDEECICDSFDCHEMERIRIRYEIQHAAGLC